MSKPSSPAMPLLPHRPASLRSVASNSSIGSATSLARRSRTRTRSRASTRTAVQPSMALSDSPTSELAYLDNDPASPSSSSQGGMSVTITQSPSNQLPKTPLLNARDTISSQGQHEEATTVVVADGALDVGNNDGGLPPGPKTQSKAALHASTLPSIDTTKAPPSAFSRVPLHRIDPSKPMDAGNVRDSVLTQKSSATGFSGTSSSLYPPSTVTASNSRIPTSPSTIDQADQPGAFLQQDMDGTQHHDSDDVSYRLRLLVQNSYFLPPAHAKPSASDFAAAGFGAAKKPARATTPAFFDLFRVGKSKSKPTTPTENNPSDSRPVLRTTADTITAGGYVQRPQPGAVATPGLGYAGAAQDRAGRVMVVRERMEDLVTAAKQAEQDMKARGARVERSSPRGQADFDDVIDPTDAVDLPLPSSSYPFAVQASALHAMGVQESIGAALLADRLPPPTSPGSASLDPEERSWRTALLHAAVGHSLDNTPDTSFTASPAASSPTPPVWDAASTLSGPTAPPPGARHILGHRIVDLPVIESVDDLSTRASQQHRPASSQGSSSSSIRVRERSSPIPLQQTILLHDPHYSSRAESPITPQTALTPPPRRQVINPIYSLSQADLTAADDSLQTRRPSSPRSSTGQALRRTVSNPTMSETYESARQAMVMTPPPLPSHDILPRLSCGNSAYESETSRERSFVSALSESPYMGAENDVDSDRRPSFSTTDGRPSLSIYSQLSPSTYTFPQPSPATSAFQDALDEWTTSQTQLGITDVEPTTGTFIEQLASDPRDSPAPRGCTLSPPPRASTSSATSPLTPPPRTSSLNRAAVERIPQVPSQIIHIQPTETPQDDNSEALPSPASECTVAAVSPEVPSPTSPVRQPRSAPARPYLTLSVLPGSVPAAIHSAPPPASPADFFDNLQTQHNAMDDLDSSSSGSDSDSESDSEGDDEVEDIVRQPSPNFSIDPRTRVLSHINDTRRPSPSFMRLGNHSTPHFARPPAGERRPSLPFSPVESMSFKPISHTAKRGTYFTERRGGRSDNGHVFSRLDLLPYSQAGRERDGRRASEDQGARRLPGDQRAQESIRRMDGLVTQHIQAEKDRIKRIATTLHSQIP